MQINLELPDDVAEGIEKDLARVLVESFAIEGYRSGTLTEEQVRRLLGFETRMEVHAFLKEHNVYLNYNRDDLEEDISTLRRLRVKEPASG
jgi:predicted HTH domain antitoxin